MKLYIDESGNTGAINGNVIKWNFDQPYFVLGGILVNENNYEELKSQILNLFKEHHVGGKLSFKHKGNRKKIDLLNSLIDVLDGCKIYFDVTNKKYKVCNYITDYCIYPYYERNSSLDLYTKVLINLCSDYLYENLDEFVLCQFIDICDSKQDTSESLISFLETLANGIKNTYIREMVLETIDSVQGYKERGMNVQNLFPLLDYTESGYTHFSISPNIDALNHMIIKMLESMNENDKLLIIHDEQKSIHSSLKKWSDTCLAESDRKGDILFIKDQDNIFIQVIDFMSGYINEYFKQKIVLEKVPLKLLNLIHFNTNIVSTHKEQVSVLGKYFNTEMKKVYEKMQAELLNYDI